MWSGEIHYWRGPSPYHFVTVPDDECAGIRDLAKVVSYGWGVVPVEVQLGDTVFTTSLFPKDGGYLVPIKDAVRSSERVDDGDTVQLRVSVVPR